MHVGAAAQCILFERPARPGEVFLPRSRPPAVAVSDHLFLLSVICRGGGGGGGGGLESRSHAVVKESPFSPFSYGYHVELRGGSRAPRRPR